MNGGDAECSCRHAGVSSRNHIMIVDVDVIVLMLIMQYKLE